MSSIKKTATNLMLASVLAAVVLGCKSVNIPFFGHKKINESTDPKEAVLLANKNFFEQKSYHSVVTTKNSTAVIETEIDFLAPDRYLIKNKIPNYMTEVITVGKDSFMRTNGGKWTKSPEGQTTPVSEMRHRMPEELVKAMKDFEFVGKEIFDGRETLVYKFKSSYQGESASKIWVSAETSLPVRVDTEGEYGGTKVETSIIYDYAKEIKIEAPQVY